MSSEQLLPGINQHLSPLEKSASLASSIEKGWRALAGGGDNLLEQHTHMSVTRLSSGSGAIS